MLKIGLFGVGHLGKIHAKCIRMIEDRYEFAGFFDPDDTAAAQLAEQMDLKRYTDPDELMKAVDVVDIVTPTIRHYALAERAISMGKHVFIEKPLTHTLEEAEQLIALVNDHPVKVQVGHVERFNPALLALEDMKVDPMFIEGHRLATFNPRGTDVSVVLDLMIHDLDIILSMVQAEPEFISASGVAVVSESPDIANARIEFSNGCVANLTASRISMKQMRKIRLFQKDAYISLDFLEKNAQVVRMYDKGDPASAGLEGLELETPSGTKIIQVSMPPIEQVNAIRMELESLADSIRDNRPTKVPIEDGFRALKVAYRIIREIEQRKLRY